MSYTRLLRFLIRHTHRIVGPMVCAGILSGLLSAGIIAVVSRVLTRHDVSSLLAISFAALVLGRIAATVAAQVLLVRFSQATILDLSVTLCSKILTAPLRLLEQRGNAQIIAILTDDVSTVTWAVQCLPSLVINAAILVCCGAYLAWLSWLMFMGAAVVTLLGALILKFLHARAFREIRAAREARATLFAHFRSLTAGIKELMMHRARREALIQTQIRPAADAYRERNLAATTRYAIADAWMQGLYYGLIGLLLFVFPRAHATSPEALTGYAFAMLYMMNPLWSVIGSLPAIARGNIALEKIDELGISIDSSAVAMPSVAVNDLRRVAVPVIELRGVRFRYRNSASDDQFALGPIDFTLRPGELVFIVGGNGSGKSTFVKVLSGLYQVQDGQVLINGQCIDTAGQATYRENFAVVFSDSFLFDRLLGLDAPDIESAANRYLKLLQMERKVSLHRGEFSTTELSQGQKKRLALVTAYLEDRSIYVFDEWAADQDPEYKDVFYTKLLPDLRSRGKAVVVITHDDRYFRVGDRVIKLDEGRVSVASPKTVASNVSTIAAV